MEADVHSNLTGIAVVALAALVCGIAMERLRQPALVGYILAGVLLGPSGFALVENREQIDVLAELGVLMLLFIVGMELSYDDCAAGFCCPVILKAGKSSKTQPFFNVS